MHVKNLDLQIITEALIFASNHVLTFKDIVEILNSLDYEIDEKQLKEILRNIIQKYDDETYPFQVILSGGGYQFVSKKEFHPIISKIQSQKFNKKLSTTALETLSIVAYRQPVTKIEIEQIRGVSADYALQRLLERNLIYISGRKEDAIGKPLLYETTDLFMDYLGINDLSELPKLKELPIQIEQEIENEVEQKLNPSIKEKENT